LAIVCSWIFDVPSYIAPWKHNVDGCTKARNRGTRTILESRQYFSIPVSRVNPTPPAHSIAAPDVSDELISYYRERKAGEQFDHFEAHKRPSAIARLAELLCRASGRRSGAWKRIMTTPAPQCRAVRRGQSAACSRRFPNSTQSRGQLFLS